MFEETKSQFYLSKYDTFSYGKNIRLGDRKLYRFCTFIKCELCLLQASENILPYAPYTRKEGKIIELQRQFNFVVKIDIIETKNS